MAREFLPGIDVADVYAAALFELARERELVDGVRAELDGLVALSEREPAMARFLTSSALDDDDRTRSLEKALRGRLNDIVLNTLLVMNAHGRLDLLPQLRRAYELRLEASRGQIEVTATSAVALDDAQRAEVEQLAGVLSGRQPLVEFVVDPAILGGLILQIGDYRYDRSIRRQLHDARARLLGRADRGLAVTVEAGPGA